MSYRFEECEFCWFHENEPAMCDECVDANQFEEMEFDEEEFEDSNGNLSPAMGMVFKKTIKIKSIA